MFRKFIIILFLFTSITFGQPTVNHPFPRIFEFTWAGISPTFIDLLPFNWLAGQTFNDSILIRQFGLNTSNRIILTSTDWNYGAIFFNGPTTASGIPLEWALKKTDGTGILHSSSYAPDITENCHKFTGSIIAYAATTPWAAKTYTINNETFTEAFARYTAEMLPPDCFDGLGSNGTHIPMASAKVNTVDLDHNGHADIDEVGKGDAWVDSVILFSNNRLRNTIDSVYYAKHGKHLFYTWWSNGGGDTCTISSANGTIGEQAVTYNWPSNPVVWESKLDNIQTWNSSTAKTPRLSGVQFSMIMDAAFVAPARATTNYQAMRGWLTLIQTTSNNYVQFEDSPNNSHYYTVVPYDEYYTRLGNPVTQHQYRGKKLTGTVAGVWVRFFGHGAMISNPTSTTKIITKAMLDTMAGYPGTLYRFRGNQDTTVNRGGAFDACTLSTHLQTQYCNQYYGCGVIPNGIILRDSNLVIMAPVVVDNHYSGTSPGSDTTTFTVSWTNSGTSDYMSPSFYSSSVNYHNYGFINAKYVLGVSGSATATATYHPKINITGDYAVYETHGWKGSSASSNSQITPVRIYHFGGSDSMTINQSINCGVWNYLGTYNFQISSTNQIVLYNNGGSSQTSRWVIADAFKLVFVPPTYQSDAPKKVFFKKLGLLENPWLKSDSVFLDCINKYNAVYVGGYTFQREQ